MICWSCSLYMSHEKHKAILPRSTVKNYVLLLSAFWKPLNKRPPEARTLWATDSLLLALANYRVCMKSLCSFTLLISLDHVQTQNHHVLLETSSYKRRAETPYISYRDNGCFYLKLTNSSGGRQNITCVDGVLLVAFQPSWVQICCLHICQKLAFTNDAYARAATLYLSLRHARQNNKVGGATYLQNWPQFELS